MQLSTDGETVKAMAIRVGTEATSEGGHILDMANGDLNTRHVHRTPALNTIQYAVPDNQTKPPWLELNFTRA